MIWIPQLREFASLMLADDYDGPPSQEVAILDNGDHIGWALPEPEDARGPGLTLVVRTEGRPRDAIATCWLSADFLNDDASGESLRMAVEACQQEAERTLRSAPEG